MIVLLCIGSLDVISETINLENGQQQITTGYNLNIETIRVDSGIWQQSTFFPRYTFVGSKLVLGQRYDQEIRVTRTEVVDSEELINPNEFQSAMHSQLPGEAGWREHFWEQRARTGYVVGSGQVLDVLVSGESSAFLHFVLQKDLHGKLIDTRQYLSSDVFPARAEPETISISGGGAISLEGCSSIYTNELSMNKASCSTGVSYCSYAYPPIYYLTPSSLQNYQPQYCSELHEQCQLSSLRIKSRSMITIKEKAFLDSRSQIVMQGGNFWLNKNARMTIEYDPEFNFPRIVAEQYIVDHALGSMSVFCPEIDAEGIIEITSRESWIPPNSEVILLRSLDVKRCPLKRDLSFKVVSTKTRQWLINYQTIENIATVTAVRNDLPFLYSDAASEPLRDDARFIDLEMRREAEDNPSGHSARLLAELDQCIAQGEYDDVVKRLINSRRQILRY